MGPAPSQIPVARRRRGMAGKGARCAHAGACGCRAARVSVRSEPRLSAVVWGPHRPPSRRCRAGAAQVRTNPPLGMHRRVLRTVGLTPPPSLRASCREHGANVVEYISVSYHGIASKFTANRRTLGSSCRIHFVPCEVLTIRYSTSCNNSEGIPHGSSSSMINSDDQCGNEAKMKRKSMLQTPQKLR